MTTMNPLAEFILAYRTPRGAHVALFGSQHFTIPIFPPLTLAEFRISPPPGAYALIIFWLTWSPQVVPNVFSLDLLHAGILFQSGTIGSINLTQGYNCWAVVTEKENAISRLTNISVLNQFFDASLLFLLVQSQADLDEIRRLIRKYGNTEIPIIPKPPPIGGP